MFIFVCVQLVGCSLLAIGIWAKVDEQSFADVVTNASVVRSLNIAAYIVIAIGAVVMVLGFLGCCGAIRESQCMLATVGHVVSSVCEATIITELYSGAVIALVTVYA
jgi:Tetraspanin family